MKTRAPLTSLAFLCGWSACSSCLSLVQDALGQARYLKAVQENWVDPIITVPLAALILVVVAVVMAALRRQEKAS